MQNQVEPQKRQYSRISMKKRIDLVKEVLKKGKNLTDVIKTLGIKITTARFIINKYKESGSYPSRKFKKNKRNSQRTQAHTGESQKSDIQSSQRDQQAVENMQQVPIVPEVTVEASPCPPCFIYWYYYPFAGCSQGLF